MHDSLLQMPGVNLPMNQISYYLLTLLVCGILHELGHAIAAVRSVMGSWRETTVNFVIGEVQNLPYNFL